jgi:16S rRNA U1498 N3-methylase RsmE
MTKFFVEQEKIIKGRIIFSEDTAHYIKRVLRLHLGDAIEIANEGSKEELYEKIDDLLFREFGF